MSEPSELLVQNLPLIEQIIAAICRRNGMDADATEEFAAEVKLRLVKDDYAVIRAFQGRSSFATFIAAVVRRLLLDYRNHEWGKWHASAEALRIGDLAVDVERLIYRDGRSVEDVLAILVRLYPDVTRSDVESLLVRLPRRFRRKRVDLEEATGVIAAGELAADTNRVQNAKLISTVVREFISGLPEDDRLLFQLRFESEMSVAQIARALHEDQQLLYRRLYKRFRELRRALESAGIAAADVEDLIGTNSSDLDFHLKNETARPSEDSESSVAVRQEKISS